MGFHKETLAAALTRGPWQPKVGDRVEWTRAGDGRIRTGVIEYFILEDAVMNPDDNPGLLARTETSLLRPLPAEPAPTCGAPDGKYRCTRRPGHEGHHRARLEHDDGYVSWPPWKPAQVEAPRFAVGDRVEWTSQSGKSVLRGYVLDPLPENDWCALVVCDSDEHTGTVTVRRAKLRPALPAEEPAPLKVGDRVELTADLDGHAAPVRTDRGRVVDPHSNDFVLVSFDGYDLVWSVPRGKIVAFSPADESMRCGAKHPDSDGRVTCRRFAGHDGWHENELCGVAGAVWEGTPADAIVVHVPSEQHDEVIRELRAIGENWRAPVRPLDLVPPTRCVCGAPSYVGLLGPGECMREGGCTGAPKEPEPDLETVPILRTRTVQGAPEVVDTGERAYRARKDGGPGLHATREGAIAAWRAAVQKRAASRTVLIDPGFLSESYARFAVAVDRALGVHLAVSIAYDGERYTIEKVERKP